MEERERGSELSLRIVQDYWRIGRVEGSKRENVSVKRLCQECTNWDRTMDRDPPGPDSVNG